MKIIDANQYSLAVYNKKRKFVPSRLVIDDMTIEGNDKRKIDTHSEIIER